MFRRFLPSALLFSLVLALTLPVLSIALSWTQLDGPAWLLLREMGRTVLPEYAATTLVLCLCVAAGVAALGMGTAVTKVLEFKDRLTGNSRKGAQE